MWAEDRVIEETEDYDKNQRNFLHTPSVMPKFHFLKTKVKVQNTHAAHSSLAAQGKKQWAHGDLSFTSSFEIFVSYTALLLFIFEKLWAGTKGWMVY